MAQPVLLGEFGGQQRRLEHRLDGHVPRLYRMCSRSVLVHQFCEQDLVERAPVHPDAHRLVVFFGNVNHRQKVLVMVFARAHVAGVDAVLLEGCSSVGELG